MNMHSRTLLIISIAPFTLLIGCASILPSNSLDNNAEHVLVSSTQTPKDCKYIGQIIGNQGNFITGKFTSNQNLEEGAMNDLRNKAAKRGANYVQLLVNRAGTTGSNYNNVSGMGLPSEQTNVTNMGNAYHCPQVALDSI